MYTRRRQLPLLLLLLLASLPGCGKAPPANNPGNLGAATQPGGPPPATFDPVETFMANPSRVFYLDVYQVAVPFGAVSRNTDFWRHVDEELIDPASKDLLLKNGVRTGIAPADDWDFFRGTIEQHPHFSRSGSAVATGIGTIELPMRQNVTEQTIWFLADGEPPRGRTYERCMDLIGVTFSPDPRKLGEMRISFSPTVRSTRTRMELTARGDEYTLVEVTPEYLYEMNLRVNIPKGRFLVVGLAPEGKWETTLGHQFLTLDGGAEMKEQLLIFVPRIPLRKPPAATQSVPNLNAPKPQ
jgi:hypothetical protein